MRILTSEETYDYGYFENLTDYEDGNAEPEAIIRARPADVERVIRQVSDVAKSENSRLVVHALEGLLELEKHNEQLLNLVMDKLDGVRDEQCRLEKAAKKAMFADSGTVEKTNEYIKELIEAREKIGAEASKMGTVYREAVEEAAESLKKKTRATTAAIVLLGVLGGIVTALVMHFAMQLSPIKEFFLGIPGWLVIVICVALLAAAIILLRPSLRR